MIYRNYKGERTDFENLTHQHLSNIYWFNKVCNGYSDDKLNLFIDAIRNRFENIILPYNPEYQFIEEIEYLNKRGHLIWNEDKTRADIVYKGKVVGYHETIEYIRDRNIIKILQ